MKNNAAQQLIVVILVIYNLSTQIIVAQTQIF